jgi:hypothetical protein
MNSRKATNTSEYRKRFGLGLLALAVGGVLLYKFFQATAQDKPAETPSTPVLRKFRQPYMLVHGFLGFGA